MRAAPLQVRDARVGGAGAGAAAGADAAAEAAEAAAPQPLLAGVLRLGERFAFTMSNPPFFEDLAEAGRNPRTACGGTAAEMVCAGGEAAFVAQHVAESAAPALRGAVQWFTTMCGKKATLRAATAQLRALRATVRTTVFAQGRTQRWGLAWSWSAAAAAAERAPVRAAAAAAPRPCAKASFTLRVGRAPSAAADALAALRAAAEAAGALRCATDAAAFAVSGALPLASGSKRPREDGGGGDDASASHAFAASVLQHAPGELTVQLALRGAAPGGAPPPQSAQAAFGALAQAVQRALTARWPS